MVFILENQTQEESKGTTASYVEKVFQEQPFHLAIDKRRGGLMTFFLNSSLLVFL